MATSKNATPEHIIAMQEALTLLLEQPTFGELNKGERVWRIVLTVCNAVQPYQARSLYFPSGTRLQRVLSNAERNSDIRRRFKGNNHDELAIENGLSVRQIRRIVEYNL